ncbi:hypothetical protein C1Y63_06120 [Corynebacterium sp. 13CS0277]|uniref:hypothetical protein n=1 Tax=Corynebacterium sp. 13CS0277 TaxID=2071994 RepID=UPI000D023FB5|nr:hypothetical protein [Corynebacterium sp. 13CS0277]PRQ11423.1 hypothetical protein C1Y63_06120 [Corynebacterium sp. 13CS0277]
MATYHFNISDPDTGVTYYLYDHRELKQALDCLYVGEDTNSTLVESLAVFTNIDPQGLGHVQEFLSGLTGVLIEPCGEETQRWWDEGLKLPRSAFGIEEEMERLRALNKKLKEDPANARYYEYRKEALALAESERYKATGGTPDTDLFSLTKVDWMRAYVKLNNGDIWLETLTSAYLDLMEYAFEYYGEWEVPYPRSWHYAQSKVIAEHIGPLTEDYRYEMEARFEAINMVMP